jgi:photosystem II stability/assembly factor-like uncharacterized protein
MTEDAGHTWHNRSDGFFGGSIGAIAVDPTTPSTVYVGGGEVTVRGNVSHGSGLWKTEDHGRSWRFLGFKDAHHIPRIRIHSAHPQRVFVAVLGHLHGPNEERGLFRSEDGGATFQRILFLNDEVGAADLLIHPTRPQWILASFWRVRRTPSHLSSGGAGSSLWLSKDGGDHWQEVSQNKGFAQAPLGLIGMAISPTQPERIYALVEAKDGGVFRSDDNGHTWKRVNEDRTLRQRAWYYSRLLAHPTEPDTLFALNVRFWRSRDGGVSWQAIDTPHVDHHDLWIDPLSPERMIIANDGGAQLTFDGGAHWTTYHNQPTAQLYRLAVDRSIPFHLLTAQQDNSTLRIPSRTRHKTIDRGDWEPSAGGESGYLTAHPEDPDLVFGGSYGGLITRYHHRTQERQIVSVDPRDAMGHGAADLPTRFQWNFPLMFSPHPPYPLYAAGNRLFRSDDLGMSWQAISPDLTTNDKSKQGSSGGPITQDNTSVEYYCTIFSLAESPKEPGVLWAGSDDGLVHLSRDGGTSWRNVTPKNLPEWSQINALEADPHRTGGVYVAATRYKLDDFSPYLFHSDDFGNTWRRLDEGLPRSSFTRVLRADPHRAGLLFCGTEEGLWISKDDGRHWRPLKNNLPIVPITDLVISQNTLAVATQGRSLWLLDNLHPLRRFDQWDQPEVFALGPLEDALLFRGSQEKNLSSTTGTNRPMAAIIDYFLPPLGNQEESSREVTLTIADDSGKVLRILSSSKEGDGLASTPGHHRLYWDLRAEKSPTYEPLVLWNHALEGPVVPPGTYTVTLSLGNLETQAPLSVVLPPDTTSTPQELHQRFTYLIRNRDELDRTHRALHTCTLLQKQLDEATQRLKAIGGDHQGLTEQLEALHSTLKSIREALYQTQNRSPQDPLNYPIRLNDQLAGLSQVVGYGDFAPTAQAMTVQDQLLDEITQLTDQLNGLIEQDWPALEHSFRDQNIPLFFDPRTLVQPLTPEKETSSP